MHTNLKRIVIILRSVSMEKLALMIVKSRDVAYYVSIFSCHVTLWVCLYGRCKHRRRLLFNLSEGPKRHHITNNVLGTQFYLSMICCDLEWPEAMDFYINLKVNFRGNAKNFLLSGSETKSWESMEAMVSRNRWWWLQTCLSPWHWRGLYAG